MVITATFDAPFLPAAPANPFGTGSATIKITGAGPEPIFRQYAATAVMTGAVGMEGIRAGYPLVNVLGMEQSNNKVWIFSFVIDPFLLAEKPAALPVDDFEIWGRIFQGNNLRIFGVTGEMKFKEVSLQADGRISGSFTISATAF